MLHKYMQELSKELEDSSLATEVPGVYSFPIDERLSVMISEIPSGFTLACTFGECPKEEQEEFYCQTLIANLFGRGTDHCILGINAEGNQLTLSRVIDYNIEYKEFRDIIEDFLNSVDFWNEEIKSYGTKIG